MLQRAGGGALLHYPIAAGKVSEAIYHHLLEQRTTENWTGVVRTIHAALEADSFDEWVRDDHNQS